ncbi:hypothetical protein QP403_21345, partial [Klebsiella michiganensis]|nr:hypothetical protein [Klebsiella michiganensis]
GPDPRNFNQRVSLGRNDLLIRTFPKMLQGEEFAFFKFKKLSLNKLVNSGSRGNLAIWVPASGNGEVRGSSNMYFSLNGLSQAYSAAKSLCSDNL